MKLTFMIQSFVTLTFNSFSPRVHRISSPEASPCRGVFDFFTLSFLSHIETFSLFTPDSHLI